MAEDEKEKPRLMGRNVNRPLPPKGCSTAFFVFLALLVAGLAIAFIYYRNQ